MFPSAEKFLHRLLIEAESPGAAPEVRCRLGRRLVRLRWSAAAAPPGKYHTPLHTHIYTHSELYNMTEAQPSLSRIQAAVWLNSLYLSSSPHTHSHILLCPFSSSYIHTALKTKRARRFPSHPSSIHARRLHTHAQSCTGKLSPSAGNTLCSKERQRLLKFQQREQILLAALCLVHFKSYHKTRGPLRALMAYSAVLNQHYGHTCYSCSKSTVWGGCKAVFGLHLTTLCLVKSSVTVQIISLHSKTECLSHASPFRNVW